MMKQEKSAAVGCACACAACALYSTYMDVQVYKRVPGEQACEKRAKQSEGWPAMDGRADEMDGMVCRGRTEILKVARDGLTVAGVPFRHSIDPSPTSGHHLHGQSWAFLVMWWTGNTKRIHCGKREA